MTLCYEFLFFFADFGLEYEYIYRFLLQRVLSKNVIWMSRSYHVSKERLSMTCTGKGRQGTRK